MNNTEKLPLTVKLALPFAIIYLMILAIICKIMGDDEREGDAK